MPITQLGVVNFSGLKLTRNGLVVVHLLSTTRLFFLSILFAVNLIRFYEQY